jgi:ABC-type multidrug transport system fused ATPase/permease subunit
MNLLSRIPFLRRSPEATDRMETLRWIWFELYNDRGRRKCIQLSGLILLGAALVAASPYGIGMLFSGVNVRDYTMVLWGVGIMLGFLAVELLVAWMRQYVREEVFNVNWWHVPERLTEAYFRRTLRMLIAEDSEIDGGGVESSREKIWTIQEQVLFTMIPSYAISSFAVLACMVAGPLYGAVALVYFAADLIFYQRMNDTMHRKIEPVARGLSDWDRRVRGRWADVPTIKYNGIEKRVERELTKEILPILREDFAIWGHWFPKRLASWRLLGGALRIALYAYAAYECLEGRLAVEMLTLIVFSLERIGNELLEVSHAQRLVQENLMRVRIYRDALRKAPDFAYDVGDAYVPQGAGVSLELERVSLWHPQNPVLRDVSLRIDAGERVAIIGPSGAGKSQLVNLILRAQDPDRGTVRVDGKDLRTLRLDSFCAHIGHVPQKAEVFEGTIRQNVCFGLPETKIDHVDDVAIWSDIRKAGLDFEVRLHDGLDTKIGYKGMRLSGGEQQRLTIARAHIKRPTLVVADEATASLDSLAEARVLDELYNSLDEGATAIMIAHRLSSLARCTKIVFVRPLHLCAPGTEQVTVHTSMRELYDNDLLFRQMAEAQGYVP